MKGTRKFKAFIYTITLGAILSGLAIVTEPNQAAALIASITAMTTGTMIPFVYGNSIENKAESGAYRKDS